MSRYDNVVVEFSDWAIEILERADAAARRLNPNARVRLARDAAPQTELRAQVPAGTIRTELVDSPQPGDREAKVGGATILVQDGVEGLIDVEEPHDRIVLKPSGSSPSARH